MTLSSKAQEIYSQINRKNTKLGDLRKIAKEIKRDHDLAMELWRTGKFFPRQLAILIMDNKQLTQAFIDRLDEDIQQHDSDERNQLTDWLMANQLTKSRRTITLMESWEHSPSAMQRRIFWYYQGRLRWTGRTPPENTAYLMAAIEKSIAQAQPDVQWAMNFTAAQIGIHEPAYRARCMTLGENLGLYKGDPVSRGCTPRYLPEWINIEVAKLKQ